MKFFRGKCLPHPNGKKTFATDVAFFRTAKQWQKQLYMETIYGQNAPTYNLYSVKSTGKIWVNFKAINFLLLKIKTFIMNFDWGNFGHF